MTYLSHHVTSKTTQATCIFKVKHFRTLCDVDQRLIEYFTSRSKEKRIPLCFGWNTVCEASPWAYMFSIHGDIQLLKVINTLYINSLWGVTGWKDPGTDYCESRFLLFFLSGEFSLCVVCFLYTHNHKPHKHTPHHSAATISSVPFNSTRIKANCFGYVKKKKLT